MDARNANDIERLIRTGLGFRDFMHFHLDAYGMQYGEVDAAGREVARLAEAAGVSSTLFLAACMAISGGHIQATILVARKRHQALGDQQEVEKLITGIEDGWKKEWGGKP